MKATVQQPQRAPDGAPVHYERHRPEQTTLYRLVQQHAATFFAQAENAVGADLVVPQEAEAPAQAVPPADCEGNCAHHHPVRLSWAKLLNRVFEIDLEHCPNCGGELKIIAAIPEQPVIEKMLIHLGLQARAPPRAPARGQALQAA